MTAPTFTDPVTGDLLPDFEFTSLSDCCPQYSNNGSLNAALSTLSHIIPADATMQQLCIPYYGSCRVLLVPEHLAPMWLRSALECCDSYDPYEELWDFLVLEFGASCEVRCRAVRFGKSTPVDFKGNVSQLLTDMLRLPEEYRNVLQVKLAMLEVPRMQVSGVMQGTIEYNNRDKATCYTELTYQCSRAGRYVRKHQPALDDNKIKELASVIASASTPFELEFTEAGDRQLIREVYERGPDSCMSGRGKHRHDEIYVDGEMVHPAEVYAHPDNNLRLAFMRNLTGKPVARCWVNIERMLYGNIYSSNDTYRNLNISMQDELERLGYTEDAYGTVNGEVLLRIDTDCGAIVCPYIDPSNMGVDVYDDYLLVGGGYAADYETGCLEDFNLGGTGMRCGHCEEHVDEDELHYSDNLGMSVCDDCCSNNFVLGIVGVHYSRGCMHVDEDFMHQDDAEELVRPVRGYEYVHHDCDDFHLISRGAGEGLAVHCDEAYIDLRGDVWDTEYIQESDKVICYECDSVVDVDEFNAELSACFECEPEE